MIRSILVALDGSERADVVFRSAVDLADSLGASMHLLRVISVPPEFPPAGHVSDVDELPGYLARQAKAQLGAFARQAPHVHCDVMVVDSTQPWRAILDAADQINADLIMLGSHGYHWLDYLLGTNAGRVANLARRNVFVVHADTTASEADSYRKPGRRGRVARG